MKIMVFDVAAESGGALSILNEYYDTAVKSSHDNTSWIFIVSKPEYPETGHVKILRFPWIKKSWIHRLYFDYFIAPSLVKENKPDKVLSLQNIMIPNVKGYNQTIYVHQSLPFVDYKFKINENIKLWIYQNIIGRMIFKSIKESDHVIVQTKWMKQACIEITKVDGTKIEVKPPEIDLVIKKVFIPTDKSCKTFFYPAGGSYYKNHRVIVDACEKLVESGIIDFNVIFTLNGAENTHIRELHKRTVDKKLPISFLGSFSRDEVFEYYTKSVLIFPSYIETFGLPLLEAKLHQDIIIASDCNFSREILHDYEKAYFFDPFNSYIVKELMVNILSSYFKVF